MPTRCSTTSNAIAAPGCSASLFNTPHCSIATGKAAGPVFAADLSDRSDTCPIDLQERVTSVFGAPLYNFWGASEVVGSLTFGLQTGPVVRIVEGAHARLVDDAGADVPHSEIGELLISGANVFAGYWNDPAATDRA